MNVRTHTINVIIVTAVFVLSYQLVDKIIDPIQSLLLTTGYASLVFLPHGVRVLAVFLYGPVPASFYLLIASLVSLLLSDNQVDKSAVTIIMQTLTGALCAPVAYQLLKFSFGSDHMSLGSVNARTWRGILMVIIVSSLINGLFQTLSIGLGDTGIADVVLSLKYTAGDILGAIFVLFTANFLLRRSLN
jgi:hypothetical protein